MVPPQVAQMIKERMLFGYQPASAGSAKSLSNAAIAH
jgi:hypothetical protein